MFQITRFIRISWFIFEIQMQPIEICVFNSVCSNFFIPSVFKTFYTLLWVFKRDFIMYFLYMYIVYNGKYSGKLKCTKLATR